MTSCFGLVCWAAICVTFLRFYKGMKIQGLSRSDLPYRAPLQPYATYYALAFICIMWVLSLYFLGASHTRADPPLATQPVL